MRGVHTATATVNVSNGGGHVMYLAPAADRSMTVMNIKITQAGSDSSEQFAVRVSRPSGTQAGGASSSVVAREGSDSASSTVVDGSTAITGLTAGSALELDSFNALGGWRSGLIPETFLGVRSDQGLLIEITDGPASGSVSFRIQVDFAEN